MLITKHCIVGGQFSRGGRFYHKCFERSLLLALQNGAHFQQARCKREKARRKTSEAGINE